MSTEKRHIGGIKAKYVEPEQNQTHLLNDNPTPVVLIVSPGFRRIKLILQNIFEQNKKHLECEGVELYRSALQRLQSDLGKRVIALVITDQPDDHSAQSHTDWPMWKAVISAYNINYTESFVKEINQEIYPNTITVITLFQSLKGKLSESDINQIEYEFEQFQEEILFSHYHCQNEVELQQVMNKEVVGMVLEKHKQRESLRNLKKTRSMRLARAQKVTKEAWRKRLG